ncbi:MAG: type IV pilus modification PilV family protein [Verrucomicrobiia bacterium]
MNLCLKTRPVAKKNKGFSLIEAMVGMGIVGIVFVSLYAGISTGVAIIQLARENLRATQIIVERMETIRLCSWEQIISGTNLPPSFIEYYYPKGLVNKQGITYYGTLTITNANTGTSYDDDLRLIIISIYWTNGNVPRIRQMQTLVAKDGMQNYIF